MITPEIKYMLDVLIGIVMALITLWVRGLHNRLDKAEGSILALNQEVTQLRLKLAQDYHDHDDLKEMLDEKLKPITELLQQVVVWIEAQSGGAPLPRKINR